MQEHDHKLNKSSIDEKALDDLLSGPNIDKKNAIYNLRKEDLDNQSHEIRNNDLRQNSGLRRIFANRVFILICIWMAAQMILLYLTGFGLITLSDKIIITLLTTTMVEVLGLFYIIIKYLFNDKSKQ